MSRIFNVLSSFAVAFLLATMVLGLSLRARDVRDPADRVGQGMATVHRLSGIAAGLVVVLVNSVVVTYFVGTSRWCKEVSETYKLESGLVRRSNVLKRSTFPLAVANMLVVVGIVALGGAADPAAAMHPPPTQLLSWTNFHFLAAGLGTLLIVYTSFVQSANIAQNHAVIGEIMAAVQRIRTERGLPTEKEVMNVE